MGVSRVPPRGVALVVGILAALLLGACFREVRPVSGEEARPLLPAGPLFSERTSFRLVLFHRPRPVEPIPPMLDGLLRERFPSLRLASEGQEAGTLPTVRATEMAAEDYPLPPVGWLELAVRRLSPREQAGLAASERLTVLEFTTEPPALETVRQAYLLALELARAHGALLWDEESAEFFSPDTWEAWRLSDWHDGEPLVERHFNNLYSLEEENVAQLVSSGLVKFGLPELELRHIPGTEVERAGKLLNLVAQLLLEGHPVRSSGRFPLSIEAVRHPGLRESLREARGRDAQERLVIALAPVDPSELDGERPRVEILIPDLAIADPVDRRHAVLLELLGARDEIATVEHDEELLAASRRALEVLLVEVKPRFLRGLEEGERLFVKASFDTSAGGTEWMWVRVQRWEGTKLYGLLDSDPADVPGLRAGAEVSVEEDSLFDYILARPDGTVEGNETEPLIIQRYQGR